CTQRAPRHIWSPTSATMQNALDNALPGDVIVMTSGATTYTPPAGGYFLRARLYWTYSSPTGGYFHTCAIKNYDRSVWCWGSNTWGELGDGTTSDRYSPVEVIDSSGTPLTSIDQ